MTTQNCNENWSSRVAVLSKKWPIYRVCEELKCVPEICGLHQGGLLEVGKIVRYGHYGLECASGLLQLKALLYEMLAIETNVKWK